MRRRPKVWSRATLFVARAKRCAHIPLTTDNDTPVVVQEQPQRHPPDLSDDEDLQLLSPIQKAASASAGQKSAPKQQKARQPRKPQLSAWKAEAIRKETEMAKAHFSEVCERKHPRDVTFEAVLQHEHAGIFAGRSI